MQAVTAGDSLTAAEIARVLDNNRKTRTILSVKPDRAVQSVFELETALEGETPTEIDIELRVENAGGPSRWRLFASRTEADVLVPSSLLAIAKKESDNRTASEKKQLTEFADYWRKQLWLEHFEHADPVHNPPSAQELQTIESKCFGITPTWPNSKAPVL